MEALLLVFLLSIASRLQAQFHLHQVFHQAIGNSRCYLYVSGRGSSLAMIDSSTGLGLPPAAIRLLQEANSDSCKDSSFINEQRCGRPSLPRCISRMQRLMWTGIIRYGWNFRPLGLDPHQLGCIFKYTARAE